MEKNASGGNGSGCQNHCRRLDLYAIDNEGCTPFHLACMGHEQQLIPFLLSPEYQFNPNVVSQTSRSLLPLTQTIKFGCRENFNFLVDHPKVDLTLCDAHGNTFLHEIFDYSYKESKFPERWHQVAHRNCPDIVKTFLHSFCLHVGGREMTEANHVKYTPESNLPTLPHRYKIPSMLLKLTQK